VRGFRRLDAPPDWRIKPRRAKFACTQGRNLPLERTKTWIGFSVVQQQISSQRHCHMAACAGADYQELGQLLVMVVQLFCALFIVVKRSTLSTATCFVFRPRGKSLDGVSSHHHHTRDCDKECLCYIFYSVEKSRV
jgi:hypothetical protein